ncbi:D-amino-acid transaminase [Heyndrickxia sporothermodurans]|uniref:D-amino-acid transaminase n=1 Tax=Heyndrickxia sporothermodurans TaxID=46224 RepID=UPI000D3C8BFF|nr:D-amino-acid transaminase [Heyndrickxia sporothermodurans]PTY80074.1 D-amino-acid transaminase [Heyndrickxia sporothermodurans]
MENIIFNGEIIERSKVNIDIEDRGYQFGDGVYEVIRVYSGKLFTKEEHINRLYESAEKISIQIPYEKLELIQTLEELVQVNQLDTGIIYLQLTRGSFPRQHGFPKSDVPPVYVAYTREMPIPKVSMDEGVKGLLIEDIRWLRCDIKSLNLLGNILAKQKAAESGCFEAIQHRGEEVTEGSSSNVFIVKDNCLITRPVSNLILNGITRQVIIKLCQENGISFKEEIFTIDDLLEADEVFISSTTSEVMPIIQVNEKVISTGKPGKITRKLQQLFQQKIGM